MKNMRNKGFLGIFAVLMSVMFLLGAGSLSTQQILNNAYDSTTQTLQLSMSTGTNKDTTALTNTVTYPLELQHETSGTPAAGIGVGVEFIQETSASNNETGAYINATVTDATAGSEDFEINFGTMAAGAAAADMLTLGSTGIVTMSGGATLDNATAATELLVTETNIQLTGIIDLEGGEVTVNDDSGDFDFTVESNGNAAAVFVDAGNDRVGIFTAAPTVAFDVTGASLFTGAFTVEGAVVINDTSADVDTRIESNGNTDAFFVDAGNDRVGIFTAAPTVPFEVTGNSLVDGTLDVEGALKLEQQTIAADDVTPSVADGMWFTTSANSGATAITDLDDPAVGQVVCLIGGSDTNSSTIADSGNFALSGAWTAALDDVLCLYVQADNDYIEISRVNN